jgi:hypothetical protein
LNIVTSERSFPKQPKLVLLVDWGSNITVGKNSNLLNSADLTSLGPRGGLVQRYSDFEDRNLSVDSIYKVYNCIQEFSNYQENRSEAGFGSSKSITVTFFDQFGFFFEALNRFSLYNRNIYCKLLYVRDPAIYDSAPVLYAATDTVNGLYKNDEYAYRVPMYALRQSSSYLIAGEELLFNGQFTSNINYDFDNKLLTVDIVSYQPDDIVGFIPQPRHVQFYAQSSTGYYDDVRNYYGTPTRQQALQYAYISSLVNQDDPWPELFGRVADYPATPLINSAEFVTYKTQAIHPTAITTNNTINVIPLQRNRLTETILSQDLRSLILNPLLDYQQSGHLTGIDLLNENSDPSYCIGAIEALVSGLGTRPVTPMFFENDYRIAVRNVWFGAIQGSDGTEYLTLNFYSDQYKRLMYGTIPCTRINTSAYYGPGYGNFTNANIVIQLSSTLFADRANPVDNDIEYSYWPDLTGMSVVVATGLERPQVFESQVIKQEGPYCWLYDRYSYPCTSISQAYKGAREPVFALNAGTVAYRPCDDASRIFIIDSKDDLTKLHSVKYMDKEGLKNFNKNWLTASSESFIEGADSYMDQYVHRQPSKSAASRTDTCIIGAELFDSLSWATNTLWNGIVPPCSWLRVNLAGLMRLRRSGQRSTLYVTCSNLYNTDWSAINYLTLKYGRTNYTTSGGGGDSTVELICTHDDNLENLPYTTKLGGSSWTVNERSKEYPANVAAIIRNRNSIKELGFNGFYTVPPRNPISRYVANEWYWPQSSDRKLYASQTNRSVVNIQTDHSVNFVLNKQVQLSVLVSDIAYQVGKNVRDINLGDDFGIELVDLMDVRGWDTGVFVNSNFYAFTPGMLDAQVPITIRKTPLDEVVTNMKFNVKYNNWFLSEQNPILIEKYRNRNYFGERREAEDTVEWYVYNGMYSHVYMNWWINRKSQPYLLIDFAAIMGERDHMGRPIEALQLFDFATIIPSINSNPYMDATETDEENSHPYPFKNPLYRSMTNSNIGEFRVNIDGFWGYFGRIVKIQREPLEGLIYFTLEAQVANPAYQDRHAFNPSQERFRSWNANLPDPRSV